jgi:hypothetical protein
MPLSRQSPSLLACTLDSGLTSSPIEDDGEGNVQCYNDELDTFSEEMRGWSKVNWLFAECYVYRRLRSFFAMTSHWRTFDPFFQSKADTYRSSSGAIIREHYTHVAPALYSR